MSKKITETKNYYDGIAKGYGELYHDEQILKISKVKYYFPTSGKLLDLGAGDGILNHFISNDIDLISFDLSLELLKLNSNLIENKICGDAQNLPFKDNSFDYISSFSVFQDIPNKAKAVREAFRVLKNGGIFFLSFVKQNSDTVDKLNLEIFKYFNIEKKIVDEKDLIYILKKNI